MILGHWSQARRHYVHGIELVNELGLNWPVRA